MLAAALTLPTATWAAFDNWGVAAGDYYDNSMMLDIYDGLAERTERLGEGIPTYQTAYLAITGASSIVTVTVTNRDNFLPFTVGGIVNEPHVTWGQVDWLHDWMLDIGTNFVQYWMADTGTLQFTSYFSSTNASGVKPTTLPMCNPAAVLSYTGGGFVTNTTDDGWGAISGGEAYFTRLNNHTANWTLGEVTQIDTNGTTVFNQIETFDTRYYSESFPHVRYVPGGTNQQESVNITIQGLRLIQTNQTTEVAEEVVSVSSNNTVCTIHWYSVTNMIVATNTLSANAGDWYALAYTNEVHLYGNQPYILTAEQLQEHYAYINALRWTFHRGAGSHSNWRINVDYSSQEEGNSCTNVLDKEDSWNAGTNNPYGSEFEEGGYGFRVFASMWTSASWEPNCWEEPDQNMYYEIDRGWGSVLAYVNTNTLEHLADRDVYWRFVQSGTFVDYDGDGWQKNEYMIVDTFTESSELLGVPSPTGNRWNSGAVVGEHEEWPGSLLSCDYQSGPYYFITDNALDCDNNPGGDSDIEGLSYGVRHAGSLVVVRWDVNEGNLLTKIHN